MVNLSEEIEITNISRTIMLSDAKIIDEKFKEILSKKTSISSFNTWLKIIRFMMLEENVATIVTPSKIHLEFIKGQYNSLITETLSELLTISDIKIKYLIDSETNMEFPEEKIEEVKYDNNINKIDDSINFTQQNLPKTGTVLYNYKRTQLNPRFTFNNFIQGNGNETAYASAYQVAKNIKNCIYNPLLIFGGVGLGKTHLVQAIGNYVFNNNLAENILYMQSDQFVTEIVNNIKNNTIDVYKNSLKDKDLIIIDDIQFFARKEKSQQELFHIFNYIHNNNGQIVLTSDFHPNDIHQLDDRLKSRFKMGLITDVRPPDLETRAAIIKLKAEEINFNIPKDVVMFVAHNINTNVRDLEGAVIKLSFHNSHIKNEVLEVSKAKDILKELFVSQKSTLNIDKIQDLVSEYFNIPKDMLLNKTRTKEIAEARAFAMYICTTQLKTTTKSIGAHFGNREHSTVSHAANKIQNLLNKKDQETQRIIDELLYKINLSTY